MQVDQVWGISIRHTCHPIYTPSAHTIATMSHPPPCFTWFPCQIYLLQWSSVAPLMSTGSLLLEGNYLPYHEAQQQPVSPAPPLNTIGAKFCSQIFHLLLRHCSIFQPPSPQFQALACTQLSNFCSLLWDSQTTSRCIQEVRMCVKPCLSFLLFPKVTLPHDPPEFWFSFSNEYWHMPWFLQLPLNLQSHSTTVHVQIDKSPSKRICTWL